MVRTERLHHAYRQTDKQTNEQHGHSVNNKLTHASNQQTTNIIPGNVKRSPRPRHCPLTALAVYMRQHGRQSPVTQGEVGNKTDTQTCRHTQRHDTGHRQGPTNTVTNGRTASLPAHAKNLPSVAAAVCLTSGAVSCSAAVKAAISCALRNEIRFVSTKWKR